MSSSLQSHEQQHARLPRPLLSPGLCSDSCPLCQWCHPTISSSSFTPFSSCPPSFLVSKSSPMCGLLASGSQSIETLASVLPVNIQDWFHIRLTGLFSLKFKGLSRVFSSTINWKHQFFGAQASLWSNSHICGWCDTVYWKNHSFNFMDLCWQSNVSAL